MRYATEAAHAALLSTEEGRRSVILSLVTSVANAYVNLRDLDQQLDIARQTAKIREESYHIFNVRFKAGYVSELELSQAKSDLEQVLSTIPPLEKSIAQQENALCVLLGRNPGPIPRGKSINDLGMPASRQGSRQTCSHSALIYARQNKTSYPPTRKSESSGPNTFRISP